MVDIAFSDDERLLITVGDVADGKIVIWDLATGCIVASFSSNPRPTLVANFGGWTRDVKRRDTGLYQFLTAGAGGVLLWSLNPLDGSYKTDNLTSGMGREVLCAVFSQDKNWIYAGLKSGEVASINVRQKKYTCSACLCAGGLMSIALQPDGSGIMVGGGDGSVLRLAGEGQGFVPIASAQLVGAVRNLTVVPTSWSDADGAATVEILAGTDSGRVYRVVLADSTAGGGGQLTGSAMSHTVTETHARQHAGRRAPPKVAQPSASGTQGVGISLLLHSHATPSAANGEGVGTEAGKGLGRVAGIAEAGIKGLGLGPVVAASFAPGVSDSFATAGQDNTLRVYNAVNYEVTSCAAEGLGGHPTCLSYAMDFITSGWEDGLVRSHAVGCADPADDGALLWHIPNAHKGGVTSLALAENQRFLVSGGNDGLVRVWEMRSRELISDLKQHTMPISHVQLYSDGVHALSSSRDRSFVCWDLRRETRVSAHTQRMGSINALALSKDQSLVLTGGQERRITYWDLREPEPLQVIFPAHGDFEVTTLDVSHCGRYIASGGADGVLKVWDIRTGGELQEGIGHSKKVNAVRWAPDDKQLVSVGDDGCALVWNAYDLSAPQ